MSPDKKEFAEKVKAGRAVAAARSEGIELVDASRLGDLLADLESEGFISVGNRYDLAEVAERGIEILRG